MDELASASFVAREVIGEDNVVDYTPRRSFIDKVARQMGAAMGDTLAAQIGLGRFDLR